MSTAQAVSFEPSALTDYCDRVRAAAIHPSGLATPAKPALTAAAPILIFLLREVLGMRE